jgi:hypothetical protein
MISHRLLRTKARTDDIADKIKEARRKGDVKAWLEVRAWLDEVEHETTARPLEQPTSDYPSRRRGHNTELFEPPGSEDFVRESEAYEWLLHKLGRLPQLQRGYQDTDIGKKMRKQLKIYGPFRRLSRGFPAPTATVIFSIHWNPLRFCQDGDSAPCQSRTLDKITTLTGYWSECLATSITEYLGQIWPITSRPIIALLNKMLSSPARTEWVCKMTTSVNTFVQIEG